VGAGNNYFGRSKNGNGYIKNQLFLNGFLWNFVIDLYGEGVLGIAQKGASNEIFYNYHRFLRSI